MINRGHVAHEKELRIIVGSDDIILLLRKK